jgi:GNAT superfamily N-acetyltransferase
MFPESREDETMSAVSRSSVRPLDPERDLDGYLRVMRQAEPFPRTADEWRDSQRVAGPGAFRRYLVAEVDGEIVAAAAVHDYEMVPDAVVARLVVDAPHRGQGHGTTMAAAVEALLAERDPAEVEVRTLDDDPVSRAWTERRGFRVQRHMIRSHLDLDAFDAEAHRAAVERAEATGIRFETPQDLDRLHALCVRLVPDTPDGLQAPSRDHFQRQQDGGADVVRLVARDGPTWAGVALAAGVGPEGAWNQFTGVLPEHRGRGIARALKVLVIEEVARRGRRWVEAVNHSGNAPMLAVNRALGYRPVAGNLYLRRRRTT